MTDFGHESALVWICDTEGEWVAANPVWHEWRGSDAEDEIGVRWLDGVHPDDRTRTAMQLARSAALRTPFEMDVRLRRADGEYRPMLVVGVPRVDHAGEHLGLTCSAIDISEHLDSRRTRTDAEALLRATLEATEQTGLIGTAGGAAMQRIATHITANRDHRNPDPRVMEPWLQTLDDVVDQRHRMHHRRGTGNEQAALVLCWVENLEPVRREFGAWVADELLRVIGHRIASTVRADDSVAWLGDDRFAIVLESVGDAAGARVALEAMREVLGRESHLCGQRITPQIGLEATLLKGGEDPASALAKAMTAPPPARPALRRAG